MKYLFIICFSLFLSTTLFAQKMVITGLIIDSISRTPIEYASITNIPKNKTIICNSNGFFNLVVSKTDMLSIASINHYFDTVSLNNINLNDTIVFVLNPIYKSLDNVSVTAYTNRYSLDSLERRNQFLAKVGKNKIAVFSNANSGAGIGFNIDHFSKYEKNKRKAYKLFNLMEKEQYINYRFSKLMIKKYTQLQNEALFNFMQTYRPTYKWLRNNTTEEDIKYYINDKLKLYYKREL